MASQGLVIAPPPPASASTSYQVMDPKPGYSQRYNSQGGLWTGAIQLVCGVAVVVLGIVAHIMELSWSIVSTGIWSGLMFFTMAGILGVVSHKRSTGVVVGYMIMSILAAIVAFFAGCTYAYLTAIIHAYVCPALEILDNDGFFGESINTLHVENEIPHGIFNCGNRTADLAVNACLTIIFFIEFIVALVGAGFTCGGVCCGSQPTVATTTTSMTIVAAQPPVMMPGGMPIQQGVAAAPPNYHMK